MFTHWATTLSSEGMTGSCVGSISSSATSLTRSCGEFYISKCHDRRAQYARSLRYHSRAIRSLHFHPTYPLFASSSDDGSIQIFHARVYNDLMTDPLIVPLKILRGHQVKEGLGVLQVKWVPRQPWLVSAGADGDVAVWCS